MSPFSCLSQPFTDTDSCLGQPLTATDATRIRVCHKTKKQSRNARAPTGTYRHLHAHPQAPTGTYTHTHRHPRAPTGTHGHLQARMGTHTHA